MQKVQDWLNGTSSDTSSSTSSDSALDQAASEPWPRLQPWPVERLKLADRVRAWRFSPCPDHSISRSPPSAFARSASTRQRCGTRAGCTARRRARAADRGGARRSRRRAARPGDGAGRPTVLGLAFDLEPFYAWAAADEVLGPATRSLRGFRPSLAPDPFEMLVGAITAQQVSLFAAVAIRNRLHRALRHAGRPRLGLSDARANRSGDRGRALRRRLLAPQGGVHHRARALPISTCTILRGCRTTR